MTSATAGVIKFLSGELDAARDEAQKARVVNEQCKPMIRNLAGQYDAEDEEARFEKKLKDYDAGFRALRALFARGEIMHGLAAKYLIHVHYWKIFLPIQLIVTCAALLALLAAAQDARKNVAIAYWLSLAAGALGFVAALLNTVDRYLDWRTQGELHKKAASVYGKINSEMSYSANRNDGFNEYTAKWKNLQEATGEILVPYEIVHAFDYVEQMIHEQIKVLNLYYYEHISQTPYPLWNSAKENDFLIAAYAVVANEFTHHRSWPWRLPDPKVLAITAHKKIQEQLFEVRFRDEPGMLRAIQVNYDQVLGASRMSPPLAAAPAPAADIEAPEASEDHLPA